MKLFTKAKAMRQRLSENAVALRVIGELYLIIMSFIGYWGVQSLNDMPIKSSHNYAIMNAIVIYAFYKLFYILSNRIWVSSLLNGALWYAIGMVNHYVNEFRGVAFLPWDILAVKTAGAVAGEYVMVPYPKLYIWAAVILLLTVIAFFAFEKAYIGKTRIVYSLASVAVCLGLIFGMMQTPLYKKIPDRLFLVQRYYKGQGIILSFFNYAKFLYTAPPKGYSINNCEAALKEYDKVDVAAGDNTPDNVIIIMNESFSDMSSIGTVPETEECLKYYKSLKDNVVRGNLYVPVYGGTTVNTEYEFLTGNTTAYQKGCPFSYAVRDERPSIARLFLDMGYEVHAFHPAAAVNWNRKSVYPYLGMSDFMTLEAIESENPEMINNHTIDAWDYNKVIELYENRESDKFFMFNVTMQNHGGYDFEDMERTVDFSNYGDFGEEENYFTLLKKSDDALKGLIDYFDKVPEKTMIVLFGDHQPSLGPEFLNMLYGGEIPEDDSEVNIKKYVTSFMIWTNYDIEEKEYEALSVNYLPELVLEEADITLPEYYQLLSQLRQKYPVFSVNGVIDADGNYMNTSDVENDELVQKYQFLQYNNANESAEDVLWDAFR